MITNIGEAFVFAFVVVVMAIASYAIGGGR